MSNPNPKINPFHSEDWFVETIKLDPQVQQSKINSLKQFKSKYHPQVSTISKLHQGYVDFVTFLTSNLIFSSFLTIVILSTFGVSASEILAPKEYKPSSFLFAKGYSSSFNSTQSSSSIYTISSESISYSTSSSVSSVSNSSKPSQSSSTSSSVLISSSNSVSSKLIYSSVSSLNSSVNSTSKQSLRLVPADYNEPSSTANSSNYSVSSLNLSLQSFDK